MRLHACPHEPEIKTLLQAGHWPHAAAGDLRAHAAHCRACADLILLTRSFLAERTAAVSAAQLPPPGVLWWRAQLRRRNTAIERMNRPLLGAQIFAAAIAVVATLAILLLNRQAGLRWFSGISQSSTFRLSSLLGAPASTEWLGVDWNLFYLLPVLAAAILLGGLVVYLTSEKQ